MRFENMKNRVLPGWKTQALLMFGLILISGMTAFAQVAGEPEERIEIGKEGKSIQQEVPEKEQYTYIPGERRDPFRSLLQRGGKASDLGDELTPLQKVNISELKLVGIVKDPEGNVALIQTPDGKGYSLRRGVQVGKHEGVVEKVHEDMIVVKEKQTDFLGQIKVTEVIIKLKREEESR
jgi:Tfp pilus assembly protein PilP